MDDDDRSRYYDVDGIPALALSLVAAKLVNGDFVAVIPSAVRAEGVEISEAEFDRLAESAKCQGDEKHEA